MEILPEHCLSCVHRLDVYMALLNTLEQFFDLTPDEDDRVDALVIHGIAVELLKECGIVNQGYNLLASALTYAVLDQTLLQNLKGRLYPKVATAHHTTATRVERNIRNPHINRGSLDPRRHQRIIKVFWQHRPVCQRQAYQSTVFACDE